MTFNISIEGSIASGKSSVIKELQKLAKHDTWKFYPEKVDEWKRLGPRRINLLKMFYQNPGRYALPLQTQVMISKAEQMGNAMKDYSNQISVFERTFESSAEVFAKANPLFGEVERTVSQGLSDFLTGSLDLGSEVIIFLETTPEKCLDRISKRDRPEERKVDLNYLENLHDHYTAFISKSKIPVRTIKVDQPEKSVEEVAKEAYKLIKSMYEEITDSSTGSVAFLYAKYPPNFRHHDERPSECELPRSPNTSTEVVPEIEGENIGRNLMIIEG